MQMPEIEMYHGMGALLAVVVGVLVLILWNFQRDRDNRVDIKDLICTDGAIDDNKFFRFTAWLVSTWGFVYLIVDQRFSEWYFTGYMAAWVGNALFARYLESRDTNSRKSSPPTPPKPSTPSTDVL
jgi:hypothetical protein